MRLCISLLLLFMASCATLPERGRLVMRDVQFPVRDLRYASGLRVLVERDTRRPVVAVVSLVGSGGASDPKGREGLAHLVEHLTFRARSAEGPSRWGQLEAAGAGRLNAFTSFDTTVYHELAPRESLAELLRIEGERLVAPLMGVTPEVFAVEREVVRNELRERNETGFVGQVFSYVQEASFPQGHPYSRPIIGSHESLSALTLADAQSFVRHHYRPENTTLVIIGDVDPDTVDELLAKHLPARLLGEGLMQLALDKRLADTPPAVPLSPSAKLLEREAAVSTPELYLSWTLPRGYDEASFLQDFVERALPDGLHRALARDGDIVGLSTSLIPGKDASLLVVRVVLRSGEHPEKSAERVVERMQYVWSGATRGSSSLFALQRWVERQQLSVVTSMALEAEDLLARALRRARLTHFTLEPRAYTRSFASVTQVDDKRLMNFSEEYLRPERARIVLVRPSSGGGMGALAEERVAPLMDEEDAPANGGPLTPPPGVADFRTLRLENGLEVVLGSTPGMPLVTVAVRLHGGSALGEPLGVTRLASAIVFPESGFKGSASDHGLRQYDFIRDDHAFFGFSGAAGNLPNMLAMTAEQLSSRQTTNQAVFAYRELAVPYIQKAELRPEYKAARDFRAALYPRHPYGRVPLAEDLMRVGEWDIEAWVRRTYQPGNAVVAIVGELDLDETEKQVRTWLSGWRGSRGKVDPPPPQEVGPGRMLVTARPGATQTQVALGCALPWEDAASAARYELMAELASKRLYRQVRSSLGASYGFSGWARVYEGGAGHLEVHGSVENAQLQPALAAVRQVFQELARGQLRPGELEAARRRVRQRQSLSLGTSAALARAVVEVRSLGWSLKELERFPEHLSAVTPEALQGDFTRCAKHLVVSLVGDEAAVKGNGSSSESHQ